MSFFSEISTVLIPIMALLIPVVAIISAAVMRITRLNLLHETVRILSANGQPIPPELLSKLTEKR